ncbi:hypothetical protein EDD15DRAFT_1898137 [Pisolithus albus]|nr:hypothetical protein EDD15DRAFT_1898137 [Pisolithus albus]
MPGNATAWSVSHTCCTFPRFPMNPDPSFLASIDGKPGLLIDFLIVGGGITGLACALALRRIGHRVTVLERLEEEEISRLANGGGRLPPNASKILFQWGLEAALREFVVSSPGVEVMRYDTGDLLGTHTWEEEILREAGGEYLFYHHGDLWRLLLRVAVDAGADVRLGVTVTSINGDDCGVELSDGVVLRADVVVAAVGGSSGLRTLVSADDKCLHDSTPVHCRLYSLFVPSQVMLQDHLLAEMYIRPSPPAFLWLGHRACALGNRVVSNRFVDKYHFSIVSSEQKGVDGFLVHLWVSDYPRSTANENEWIRPVDEADWEDLICHCEPRLQRLVRGATFRASGPVKIEPQLDNWVHHSDRVLLVGAAAHPLPVGSVQLTALCIEDAAVFAKLFSHLTSEDQIPAFLHAFQDLREPRCARVLHSERCNLTFRMLPNGPEQEERDSAMRERHARGISVFGSGGGKLTEQWDQLKELFGYNAEDEADDWWVKWGLLRERAKDRSCELEERVNISVLSAQLQAVNIRNDDDE